MNKLIKVGCREPHAGADLAVGHQVAPTDEAIEGLAGDAEVLGGLHWSQPAFGNPDFMYAGGTCVSIRCFSAQGRSIPCTGDLRRW